MSKVRITILADMDFDKEGYRKQPDDVTLTDAEVEALTEEEMLALDKKYLADGQYSLGEYIDYGDVDLDDVKLELIEE